MKQDFNAKGKYMLKQWRQRLTANSGYTIDQTILIVAIIAILITLIIITIGWQLIGRSNGTKLGAQLRQIEDANGTFYSEHKMWANQALTNSNPTNNVRVLLNQTSGLTFQTSIDTDKISNLLPGIKMSGGNPIHNIGSGGAGSTITQQVNVPSAWGLGGGQFMVVQFAAVPYTEATQADEAIDGTSGFNSGRLVYSSSTCLNATSAGVSPAAVAATSGVVFVCYAANSIQ